MNESERATVQVTGEVTGDVAGEVGVLSVLGPGRPLAQPESQPESVVGCHMLTHLAKQKNQAHA